MNPVFFALVSMAVLPIFGFLSWTFAERPSLQLEKLVPKRAERRVPEITH